ncbi:hypothetical protein ScPMuIL_007559 [Solemya velum]
MLLHTIIQSVAVGAMVVLVQCDKICESDTKLFEWKADPDDCSAFYLCFNGNPLRYKCPQNSVVHADSKSCVATGSTLDKCTPSKAEMDLGELSQSKCQAGTAKYFAHPEDCAKYYACGDDDEYNDEVTLNECPYPLLFNDELNRCEFHITVKCGKRRELKDPCEYSANQCTRSSHCIPCNVRFPSCAEKEDGLNSWTGREWSPYFAVCKEGRVVYQDKCKQDGATVLFHPEKLSCYEESFTNNNSN